MNTRFWLAGLLMTGLLCACMAEPSARLSTPAATVVSRAATLPTAARDSGYDADGNGFFEQLRLDLDVDVATSSTFAFDAILLDHAGGTIVQGSLQPERNRAAPAIRQPLTAGHPSVTLYFDGRALRSSGIDGPYQVQVVLGDDHGTPISHATYTTAAYDHRRFQGKPVTVLSIRDQGVNTNARHGLDILRVTVQLDVQAPVEATVQSQLSAGETLLGNIMRTTRLQAGTQSLDLDFPAATIATERLDGPYTVSLSIGDARETDDAQYTTTAYRATDFEQP